MNMYQSTKGFCMKYIVCIHVQLYVYTHNQIFNNKHINKSEDKVEQNTLNCHF